MTDAGARVRENPQVGVAAGGHADGLHTAHASERLLGANSALSKVVLLDSEAAGMDASISGERPVSPSTEDRLEAEEASDRALRRTTISIAQPFEEPNDVTASVRDEQRDCRLGGCCSGACKIRLSGCIEFVQACARDRTQKQPFGFDQYSAEVDADKGGIGLSAIRFAVGRRESGECRAPGRGSTRGKVDRTA